MFDIILKMDFRILSFFNQIKVNVIIDWIMIFFTLIGEIAFIWVIIILFLLKIQKYRQVGIMAVLALLFSLLFVNLMIKPSVQRIRPFQEYNHVKLKIDAPSEFSFPSGHSSSSFAVAAVIIFMLEKKGPSLFLIILAVLIAFSRVYLNVHYFSDIIGGLIIGVFCSFCAIKTGKFLIKKIPEGVFK